MTNIANVTPGAPADLETEFVTATVTGDEGVETGISAAYAEGNPWFPQLPAAKQTEAVKYAVQFLANNSNLFQVVKHGGTYQERERITIAIARSGIKDAETIF